MTPVAPGPGTLAGAGDPTGDAMTAQLQDMHDLRAVLAVAPFRRLWIALSLSSLGDWLGLLATTALASELATGFAAQNYAIGGVLFVRLLPALLLGPFAGAMADRFNRRITMVTADLIRFGLYVSIPLVRSLPWLIAASFLIEAVSLFWIPAKEASVPNLLPRERLEAANQLSLLTTYGSAPVAAGVFFLLSIVNSALAAAIPFFQTNSVDLALYFDAATFLFSAATISQLRGIGRARRAVPDGDRPTAAPTFIRSIVDGWRFVGATPLIRGLIVGMLGAFAAGGAVVALGRSYVSSLDGGNAAYGVLFGSIFIGLAGGMFLGPRLLVGFSRRRMAGLAIIGAGASLCVVAVLPNLVLALLFTVSVGGFAGIAWVVGYTLLGREVDDSLRGRTFAFVQSVVRVDLLLVLAVAPFLAGIIGLHTVTVGGAHIRINGVMVVLLVGGLTAVALGFTAYRQMDDRPGVPLWADLVGSVRDGLHDHGAGRRKATRGLLVAFEGGEGAGKSTQCRLLVDWLHASGHSDVVLTREPGATAVGQRLRELLLDPATGAISPRTEALLYAADRAEHVDVIVRPAVERGAIVVTDRYVDSSLAYQAGGRTLTAAEVARISTWATGGLLADLTVLLDVPPTLGRSRSDTPTDRMEAEPAEFHERVRTGFRDLAERHPRRYLIVDAAQPAAEVHRQIKHRLRTLLTAPAAESAEFADSAERAADPTGVTLPTADR